MRKIWIALMAGALATFGGCQERDRAATVVSPAAGEAGPVEQTRPAIDACSLLTSEEIKSIQGEGFQSATPSGQDEGELASAQCFFALPNAADSISLHVVWQEKPGGQDAKQAWATMFSPEKLQVRETSSGKKEAPAPQNYQPGRRSFLDFHSLCAEGESILSPQRRRSGRRGNQDQEIVRSGTTRPPAAVKQTG